MSTAAPPIAATSLAARHAPPLVLPGEHFAAGLGFLVAGAVGLMWVAPELARGWYPSARVIGVTHLFTLGWLTLSIWGALYQFLPVALGKPIRWAWLAHVTFGLFVPGLAAFVLGLALGEAGVMLFGAAAFGLAVAGFCVNLWATLATSGKRDLTWWSLLAAGIFLLVTLLVGAASAGNLLWGYLGVSRWTALAVHMHVALAGWVLMVVIGVAHRLLPMFLLSHGASERWGRTAGALVASGVSALVLFHHGGAVLAHWVPAVLIGAGLASFLVQARTFYGHRVKPKLDPGLRLAAAALGVLAGGLVLGVFGLATSFGPARLATAYGTALVLGLSLFVAAHYYKIVPFLVWFHRYGPLIPERKVPTVSQLYSALWATAAGAFLLLGVLGLLGSILAGSPGGARIAATAIAGGVIIETAQMGRLAWHRP